MIPRWPVWPVDQECQLAWTTTEAEYYSNALYGNDPRFLDVEGQAPTALHSWGVALTPCPCGCRNFRFAESRLVSGGLRGFGIHSTVLGDTRFLHPAKAGLLNSVPVSFAYDMNCRGALCLVGQIAAPLQVVWIASHIMRWFQLDSGHACPGLPIRAVEAFKECLIQGRHDLWITPDMQVPRSVALSTKDDGVSLCFTTTSATQCFFEVLEAIRPELDWGTRAKLFDGDRELPPHALLHGAETHCYRVAVATKVQVRPKPDAQVDVTITQPGRISVVTLAPGAFLFEALHRSGLSQMCLISLPRFPLLGSSLSMRIIGLH